VPEYKNEGMFNFCAVLGFTSITQSMAQVGHEWEDPRCNVNRARWQAKFGIYITVSSLSY